MPSVPLAGSLLIQPEAIWSGTRGGSPRENRVRGCNAAPPHLGGLTPEDKYTIIIGPKRRNGQ